MNNKDLKRISDEYGLLKNFDFTIKAVKEYIEKDVSFFRNDRKIQLGAIMSEVNELESYVDELKKIFVDTKPAESKEPIYKCNKCGKTFKNSDCSVLYCKGDKVKTYCCEDCKNAEIAEHKNELKVSNIGMELLNRIIKNNDEYETGILNCAKAYKILVKELKKIKGQPHE
jgi:hypothetical protein